jgi:molecular chaperone Hsp33
VRVFEPVRVHFECGCSRENLLKVLRRFSAEERAQMVEDGKVTATCQYCSETYTFTPEELDG